MPAKSIAQQRFMGMVHAAQKGELKDPSPEVASAAKSIKPKAAKEFAATKHKNLPKRVKQAALRSRAPGARPRPPLASRARQYINANPGKTLMGAYGVGLPAAVIGGQLLGDQPYAYARELAAKQRPPRAPVTPAQVDALLATEPWQSMARQNQRAASAAAVDYLGRQPQPTPGQQVAQQTTAAMKPKIEANFDAAARDSTDVTRARMMAPQQKPQLTEEAARSMSDRFYSQGHIGRNAGIGALLGGGGLALGSHLLGDDEVDENGKPRPKSWGRTLGMGLLGAGLGAAGGAGYGGYKAFTDPHLQAMAQAADGQTPVAPAGMTEAPKGFKMLPAAPMPPGQQGPPSPPRLKLGAAREWAEKLASGATPWQLRGLLSAIGAGTGAAVGGVAGGVSGLVDPDKKKGRLQSALRRALIGGGVGLAGGAVAPLAAEGSARVLTQPAPAPIAYATKMASSACCAVAPRKRQTYKVREHEKQAYGNNVDMQMYSPQENRRELTPKEQSAVSAGQSQWIPRIFQNYSTPVPEMMSSPGKGALLYGAGGAALGGLAGNAMAPGGWGAGLGALGGGGLAALLGYFSRQSDNQGMEELMRRLPQNATKRDLLADPAYQADLDRQELREANARRPGLSLG